MDCPKNTGGVIMGIDMFSLVWTGLQPLLSAIKTIFVVSLAVTSVSIVTFVLLFLLVCPFYLKKDKKAFLINRKISFKYYDLIRWMVYDFITRGERRFIFKPFGFTIFVGRQGQGKTISLVKYLHEMKKRYPKCLIICNFESSVSDMRMKDWHDLLEINNGEDGVIFAIDEIHSEYSSASWKDFPENILSQISMQRKQKIKIVATSQVFARVAKPIREQTFSVIECHTYFNRFTTNREYDSEDYVTAENGITVRKKVRAIWKSRFVQDNVLRASYDTYEKIERMRKVEFIPRNERH